jgi:hypothetical protein
MVGINGVAFSCSEQHYKKNNNSLRILAVMCRGVKTDDDREIFDFDVEPWKSLREIHTVLVCRSGGVKFSEDRRSTSPVDDSEVSEVA